MIRLKKLSVLAGIYAGGLGLLCSMTNLEGYVETRNMFNRIGNENKDDARIIAETDLRIVDTFPEYVFFYGVKRATEEYLSKDR